MVDNEDHPEDNDGLEGLEHSLDDDLDLNLEEDLDLGDDFESSDDDLLMSDGSDEFDSETTPDVSYSADYKMSERTSGASSIIDMIKSYGVVVLIAIVFGYFGFKYSLGSLLQSNDQVVALSDDTAPDITSIPSQVEQDSQPLQLPNQQEVQSQQTLPDLSQPTPADQGAVKSFDPLAQMMTDSGVNNDPEEYKVNVQLKSQSDTSGQLPADVVKQDMSGLVTPPGVNTSSKLQQNNIEENINQLTNAVNLINQKINSNIRSSSSGATGQQISDITTKIEQLRIYTEGLSKSLGTLAEQVKNQQGIGSGGYVVSDGQNNGASGATKNINAKQVFTVEAVISGRAWLKTSKGHQFTVSVGDEIPGYGKVSAINARKGMVTTNTGMVLK